MLLSDILNGIGFAKGTIPPVPFKGVSIDSRKDCSDKIFFAIKGNRFDGHDFVRDAFGKGAVCAVVERDVGKRPLVIVGDTLEALQDVAVRWRERVAPKVVAVTGSSGKTTTKEMVRTILGDFFSCEGTKGNENNLIGVPLNLANMSERTQVFVAELGTNAFGEIEKLAEMCMPDISVITAIGEAHLEGLGDLEGVFREKTSLVKHTSDYLVFPDVSFFAEKASSLCIDCGVTYFGVGSVASGRYFVEEKPGTYRIFFNGKEFLLRAKFCGSHMGLDALMALSVAYLLGVPLEKALERLSEFEPVEGRFKVESVGGLTIIDDTYNANPISTKAALEYLKSVNGKRIFVFGSMLELGEDSGKLHREIGEWAYMCGVDFMITYGRDAGVALESFRALGGKGIHCSTHEEAVEALKSLIDAGSVVLVKGSRGMRMEKVVEGVKACFGS